eukprot:scaffold8.g1441.t1
MAAADDVPPAPLARVKELTSSMAVVARHGAHQLGKAVLSTTKAAVHRRVGSVDGLVPPDDGEERQAQTDCYGFEILVTPEQAEALARCRQREDAQRAKWAAHPAGGGLPPPDRLKRLCRRGVPPELRRGVWLAASGAAARRAARHPSYYSAMAQLGKHESPWAHQIRLDTPRTFPANAWVQSGEGQEALARVLYAFARHKPDVGYCQGMNYVAALLLLVLGRAEEDAFWVLASLIDDDSAGILYQDMYATDLTGTHVEMRSLRELVERKLPRLAAHLDALGCDMSIVATDWFLCLFATTMPAESAARVWDALLVEGPKVLFRVALALLRLHERALLAQDNPGELLRAARRCAAQAYDRDELMRVAFEGVGSMPMDTIRRHRAMKQAEVDHEMAARETRLALRSAVGAGFVVQGEEEALFREPVGAPPSGAAGGEAAAAAAAQQSAAGAGGMQRSGSGGAGSGWRAQLAALGERTRDTLAVSKHKLAGTLSRGRNGSSSNHSSKAAAAPPH